jgi:hypothetical protein
VSAYSGHNDITTGFGEWSSEIDRLVANISAISLAWIAIASFGLSMLHSSGSDDAACHLEDA